MWIDEARASPDAAFDNEPATQKVSFVQALRCLAAMLATGVLLGACSMRHATLQPNLDQTSIPTTESATDITDLVAGRASYRGITPGSSHKRDVLDLWGEPNVIRTHAAFESLHYFSDIWIEEYFLIKNDIVQAVTSNVRSNWLTYAGDAATADDLYHVLGTPEMVTPTLGYRIQVFPDYGLAIPEHLVVFTYQFFAPTSLQEYQALWGTFPLDYDPFPLIPSVEAVKIRPGKTTRDQVKQLLGPPDRIGDQNRNSTWDYWVEPDMLGSLAIFFDDGDIVEYIDISPLYLVPEPLLLEEAVNQYGQPDMIQLIPDFEGHKYATLALLYLDQGVRIATGCPTPACETVKRDAIVGQKWYFEPTTLAEYQAAFPDPEAAYIEWHGFDE